MSYQDHNGGYPPPRENESQYPPPPGEEDDRARAYHPHQRNPSAGASNITLPSIAAQYDPQYQPPNGYAQDPRAYGPQDPYRVHQPPPPTHYRDDRQYQGDYGRGSGIPGGQHIPGPGQHMNGGGPGQHMTFNQSAPRQRTAIACRYCRRRKIRCSGFDQNPEGRCTNCQRFQQDCIFTPVSSQAQAFVPAHALYPNMRPMGMDGRPGPQGGQGYPQGTQLYGAHGQPLAPGSYPNHSGTSPNQQGPSHHGLPGQNHQGGSPYSDYSQQSQPAQPSPTNSYGSFGDERDRSAQPQDNSRKRPQPDGHQQILPPPVPGQPGYSQAEGNHRRPAVQDELRLPPVTPTSGPQAISSYSPGSSHSSHSTLQPQQAQSGLPSRTPPPRGSPGDGNRVDKMSLGSIMGAGPGADIDSNMKGRLNRKG